MEKQIKLGMVDDHQVFLDGLSSLFSTISNVQISFTANTKQELLSKLTENELDILILDLELPDGHGIDICKELNELYPTIKILILSMHQEERLILHLLKEGANGYLSKTAKGEELKKAIFHLIDHEFFLSDAIGTALQKHLNKRTRRDEEWHRKVQISDREKEVLEKMLQGKTSKEIGEELFISKRTVDAHRNNLIEAFNARNAIDMIVKALALKIVSLPIIFTIDKE